MSSYSDIRKTVKMTRAGMHNSYRNGGATSGKKSTVVNVIVPPSRGQDAPEAPEIAGGPGMAPPPSRMPSPPAPVPPVAAGAALGAMGANPGPMMKRGGKVRSKHADGGSVMKGGAGGGLGRLEKAKKAKV